MSLLITTRSTTTPGPTVSMNCLHCHAMGVSAESFEQLDHVGLFYVLTVFNLRNTFVQCSECKKQLISKVTINEIQNYSSADLSGLLVRRVPLVSTLMAFASIAVCWAPFFGLVIGIIAILANRRVGGWRLRLSWIGMILQVLVIIAVVVLIARGN